MANVPFMIGPEDAEAACLVIHGFSGTPEEMRGLGEAIASQGIRVYGVLLAGHNGDPEELIQSGRKDWLNSAEEALMQLAGYKTVFVAGLSMGGVLALNLAIRHPDRISGVIAMSTPTRLDNNIQLRLVPLARYVIKWYYPLKPLNFKNSKVQAEVLKQSQTRDPSITSIDFNDQKVVEYIKTSVRIPVPAIAELLALINATRKLLDKLRIPLLIIQSKRDQTVKPECAEELYNLTSNAPSKSLHWLAESSHVITTGVEREEVYQLTNNFIKTLNPPVLETVQPESAQKEVVDGSSRDHL